MPTLDDLESAYSSTELHELCENGRVLFFTAYDRLHVVAAELRRSLSMTPVANTQSMLGGPIQSRTAARRVTKPLVHAAELNMEAAKAMRSAWFMYRNLYVPNGNGSGQKPRFNVNG